MIVPATEARLILTTARLSRRSRAHRPRSPSTSASLPASASSPASPRSNRWQGKVEAAPETSASSSKPPPPISAVSKSHTAAPLLRGPGIPRAYSRIRQQPLPRLLTGSYYETDVILTGAQRRKGPRRFSPLPLRNATRRSTRNAAPNEKGAGSSTLHPVPCTLCPCLISFCPVALLELLPRPARTRIVPPDFFARASAGIRCRMRRPARHPRVLQPFCFFRWKFLLQVVDRR